MDMKKVEEDIEYLLPVRFGEILCSGCRGDVENVKVYDRRQRTTDAGWCAMTIAHLSLALVS